MNKKATITVLVIIILALISFLFDYLIVQTVESIRNQIFDNILLGITFLSSEIIIFVILTTLFLWQGHKRRWILPLWFTLFLSAGVSFILKVLVHRSRPFQLGIIEISPLIEASTNFAIWNFSFPSFQTMLVFCAIPILTKEFKKLKYAWITLAILVAFSRIYFGFHFFSDVIAGALIG